MKQENVISLYNALSAKVASVPTLDNAAYVRTYAILNSAKYARKEAADRRVRRSDLEEEISKIYDIPARIRRASVADGDPIPYGQDDYDDSASD